MHILLAPDKFKGCLSAIEVARAMAEGVRSVDPTIAVDECPVADGGEGTVAALVAATGGRVETAEITGPLPDMCVRAPIGITGDGATAIIEMAAASGLHLLAAAQRDPMRTTTYGTGELLGHAIGLGVRRIILGIGGSATCDGGVGAAQACGARLQLNDGTRVTRGDAPLADADVGRITAIAMPDPFPVEITVACDVTSPLYGPSGAAVVYGPQKGATPPQVEQLDQNLRHLATVLGRHDLPHIPGAGAAGGLGFGMIALFGATLRSGADIVIEAVNLRERLGRADLCITGEGQWDAQSLAGKAPAAVARACRDANVPCIVIAGQVRDRPADLRSNGIAEIRALSDDVVSVQESMRNAAPLLAGAAADVIRRWRERR